MKNSFLIITFLIASCFGAVAQDKKSLETSIAKWYKNTVEAKNEAMVEDLYPKIFELAPKEQLLESLNKAMDGNGFTMVTLDTPPNFEYGPIKKIGEGSYCLIKQDVLMKMTFKAPLPAGEDQQMIESFKTRMKASDVTFDAPSNSFTIKQRTDVIAVADKLTGNQWKFINRGPAPVMEQLLDKNIVKELGL